MFGKNKWRKHYDESKFDLVDINQFRTVSFGYVFSYFLMYVAILIAVAVFASDIYTAVVLLAYDRWSSEIDPSVPINISRWIFSGCIILSTLLIIFDFIVAIRIYREQNISATYTNSIARKIYSIKGYNYFCLFGKITKSRSKTEYLAIFVYFALKGWLRLIFADGPRQVINALTLYSVLKVDTSFYQTLREIATQSTAQALVIAVMLFSLVVWVINVIEFIFALLCAIPLYVHVEKTCSGLEEYCYVRINSRIAKIVRKYHERDLIELKEENKRFSKRPTLPVIFMNNQDSSATLVNTTNNASSSKLAHQRTSSNSSFVVPPAGSFYGNSTATGSTPNINNRKKLNPEFDPFENSNRNYQPLRNPDKPKRSTPVRFDTPVQRKPVAPSLGQGTNSSINGEQLVSPHERKPESGLRMDHSQQAEISNSTGRSTTVPPVRSTTVPPNRSNFDPIGRSATVPPQRPDFATPGRSTTVPPQQSDFTAPSRSTTVPPGSMSGNINRTKTPLVRPSTANEYYSPASQFKNNNLHGLRNISHQQQEYPVTPYSSSMDQLNESTTNLIRNNSNSTLASNNSNNYYLNNSNEQGVQPEEVISSNVPAPPLPIKEVKRKPSRGFQIEASDNYTPQNSKANAYGYNSSYPFEGRERERETEIIDLYYPNQNGSNYYPYAQQDDLNQDPNMASTTQYFPNHSATIASPQSMSSSGQSDLRTTFSPNTPTYSPDYGRKSPEKLKTILPYPVNDPIEAEIQAHKAREQHNNGYDNPPELPAKIPLSLNSNPELNLSLESHKFASHTSSQSNNPFNHMTDPASGYQQPQLSYYHSGNDFHESKNEPANAYFDTSASQQNQLPNMLPQMIPQGQRTISKVPSFPELPRNAMVRGNSSEGWGHQQHTLRQQRSIPMLPLQETQQRVNSPNVQDRIHNQTYENLPENSQGSNHRNNQHLYDYYY